MIEELETEIEGILMNGVDIIKFSDDGRLITRFTVMVRPLEAIKLLQRLMGEQHARHNTLRANSNRRVIETQLYRRAQ